MKKVTVSKHTASVIRISLYKKNIIRNIEYNLIDVVSFNSLATSYKMFQQYICQTVKKLWIKF